ncbi:MAG TPA: helix-turn-helix domain-containing protein [Planctomycetota bacterium]|nr:helix-turn-helix domain-containing protein [Planctomycetota bacterium]
MAVGTEVCHVTAQPNQSLGRGLEVLHALCGAEGPIGSRELSRRLGMEHTRVNRLLGTMAALGLAERTADRRYRPGPAVHVLAASSLRSSGLLQAALPIIRELHAEGFGAALGVLWRDQVCYLYHGKPNQPLERGLAGHQLFPAAWSSIGTILRAQTDPELVAHKELGWAWVVPPKNPDLPNAPVGGSMAAPVGSPIVAALAIIPSDKSNPAQFAPRLLAAAAAITAAAIPAPRSAATAAKPT